MNKKEKEQKLKEYGKKVQDLLGYHLWGYRCEFAGDHPVIHIIYYDYKTSIITRAEIQQLIPEAELARVERRLSRAALLYAIEPTLDPDYEFDHVDEGTSMMVHHDYEYDEDQNEREVGHEETPLYEWAKSKLIDTDLSEAPLRYLDDDMDLMAPGVLTGHIDGTDRRFER